MIRVTVGRQDGTFKSFRCSGHAGYEDRGKDVVCAAVSILVINTVNAIDALTDQKIEVESDPGSGDISMIFIGEADEKAVLLTDAMMMGLSGIEKQYGEQFIQIKEVAEC